MIGLWFVQNLLSGLATIGSAASPSEGVAWFAHVGGFLFGAVLTLFVFRPLLRRPPKWRER
jgi:membrane associated rhomboid family serine protease